MTYPTDHAGLEVLPFDTCLELLASVPVGRIDSKDRFTVESL